MCLCSNEGTTEEKERLQNETNEPKIIKIKYMSSKITEKKYSTTRSLKTILSSEILRPKGGRELLES